MRLGRATDSNHCHCHCLGLYNTRLGKPSITLAQSSLYKPLSFPPVTTSIPSPLFPLPHSFHSPNNNLLILREPILRHRQIQRRRPLSHPPGDIVVGAVAGTEPAAEVAGFANGDAAEVGAYA